MYITRYKIISLKQGESFYVFSHNFDSSWKVGQNKKFAYQDDYGPISEKVNFRVKQMHKICCFDDIKSFVEKNKGKTNLTLDLIKKWPELEINGIKEGIKKGKWYFILVEKVE